jgi:hypothetical protein
VGGPNSIVKGGPNCPHIGGNHHNHHHQKEGEEHFQAKGLQGIRVVGVLTCETPKRRPNTSIGTSWDRSCRASTCPRRNSASSWCSGILVKFRPERRRGRPGGFMVDKVSASRGRRSSINPVSVSSSLMLRKLPGETLSATWRSRLGPVSQANSSSSCPDAPYCSALRTAATALVKSSSARGERLRRRPPIVSKIATRDAPGWLQEGGNPLSGPAASCVGSSCGSGASGPPVGHSAILGSRRCWS